MWSTGNESHPSVPSQSNNWEDAVSRPKRRKIEIACTTCRLRKSRCDGGIPKCGACMRRRNVGPECVYLDAGLESRSSPSALATRFRQEDDLTAVGATVESTARSDSIPSQLYSNRPSTKAISVNASTPSTYDRSDHETAIRSTGHLDSGAIQHRPLTGGSDTNESSDWMLKAGLLAASSSTKFFNTIFGNSSTQEAQTTIPDQLELMTQENDNSKKSHRPIIRRKSIHSPDYVLPSRQVADDLLNNFYDHVYIQWFDRAEFTRWYEGLWTGKAEIDDPLNDQINYALLNMIFALVYRTETETIAEDQEQLAQVHFLRAQKLLQLDILSFSRINLLYALFMFLQWYQSVNDVQRCNSLVRICILVAQNIGLDVPERIANLRSQRQREMARRAWHGCILMDRIISMVSGQPLKISQELAMRTTLFQAIDDEYLTMEGANGAQPAQKASSHNFFLAFCQLHLILGDILLKSQSDRHEKRVHIDVNHTLEVDENLSSFAAGLPSDLSFKSDKEIHDTEDGRTIHLQTRFLHIRILLFRPFFLRAAETWKKDGSTSTGNFAHAVILQGLLACVATARKLLVLLGSRLNAGVRGPHLVPQWWHTVAYVYTATTVLIAAHMFPVLLEEDTMQNLSECIEIGFQILDTLSQQKDTAKQCKAALVMLYERHAKRMAEAPKHTPHGTVIPPDQYYIHQYDGTDLSMNLDWAFLDPLDLFNDRDVGQIPFPGDIYSTDTNNWL